MALQLFKIASVTVATPQANIQFSSIPQGYSDLYVVLSARSTRAATGDSLFIRFNSDTTSSCPYKQLYWYSTSSGTGSSSPTWLNGNIPSATATANIFGLWKMYIPNYTVSMYKTVDIEDISSNNSTTDWQGDLFAATWQNNAAINDINIYPNGGNFVANSTATLYGVL